MPITQVPKTGVFLSGGKNEIAGYPFWDLVGTRGGPEGSYLDGAHDPRIVVSKSPEENPAGFLRGPSGTPRDQISGHILNEQNSPAHASGNR